MTGHPLALLRWAACVTAALTFVLSASVSAQQPMVYRGARVRLTWNDPPRWINATVENPASRGLTLVAAGENLGTIIINESTRLQLYRGRHSPTVLSAVVGGLVGGTASGILLRNSFGREGTAFATSQAVIVGAAAGALIGTIFGVSVLGHPQWVDIPIERGRIVYPPLESTTRDNTEASFSARQRWTRFEATEPMFAAFFQEYQPRLHGVEGIYWSYTGGGRVAIVRDERFPEFQYVMVNLREVSFPRRREIGDIIAALRVTAPSRYEIRYIPSSSLAAFPAELAGGSLNILVQAAVAEQWIRVQ